MQTIAVTGSETIRIGRVGENRAVQIIWPGLLEKWRELYGDGTVQLAVRRPKDAAPYPVVCEIRENDVTWTVQAADTARHGIGECELTYLVGEKIAKSQTWATEILRSLTEDEIAEPPDDPAKTWYMEIRQEIGNLDDLETEDKTNLVSAINEAAQSGGGGGTSDHTQLSNRDVADQHPMSAITGLEKALESKQPSGAYLTDKDLDTTLKETGKAADAAEVGKRLSSLTEEIAGIPSGKDGADGQDGVGIESVVQTTTSTEDGGTNVVTVTKTDGTTSTFSIKNGSKGSAGQAGADGHTPVKGTDYWTEEDQKAIVDGVLAALPTWEGGSY